MATLSKMFELEQPTVHAIISKMVMNEELMVGLTYKFAFKIYLIINLLFRLPWMSPLKV